jgi:hemolysin III
MSIDSAAHFRQHAGRIMQDTSSMPSEERFNALTHLAGAALALLGTVVLIALAVRRGDPWRMGSFALFGVALLAQFVSSFLYHSAQGPSKATLRNIDHCAIYLLIAGTYTPFTLVCLRDNWGWPLFCAIWFLATVGLVQEVWFTKRNRLLSIVIYLVMGWLAILALSPLLASLTYKGFAWVAAGGLFYTAGTYFYVASKKGLRFGHGIWHLFVLGGSASHYLAVLLYIA